MLTRMKDNRGNMLQALEPIMAHNKSRNPKSETRKRSEVPNPSPEDFSCAGLRFRTLLFCFGPAAWRCCGDVRALLILSSILMAGCSHKDKDEAKPPAAEKLAELESHVKRGTNGATIVSFDTATQKLMGLETTALQPAQLAPELKGYGRVLDVAPLSALVSDLMTARAASAASQAELGRLKTLAAQNNASERSLQAAEAAAARDQSQAESARLRLLTSWGRAIAERPDLPALIQSLSSLAGALVQLDLPAGQSVSGPPKGARVVTLTEESKAVPVELVGPAPTVDPQLQGNGFLFLLKTNSIQLAPGASVSGFLEFPGEKQVGVELPRNAIVRFNGAAWVYVQTGEQTFERREVRLDSPLSEGWFVREGLNPGNKVVMVGAQQLLSEEQKGQAGE